MARTTKAELDQLVEVIKTNAADDGYFIEYAYGRPRLYLEVGGSVKEIGPKLSARDLAFWLEGFVEGIDAGISCGPEEEEIYDNPSYRGYYIYPDLARRSWFIQKAGFHIATEISEGEAQRTVDDLLDDDE